LNFIYPIYNHNWRKISTIYTHTYITRLASKEIFSPSNKIHREVGRAKDLSVVTGYPSHCRLSGDKVSEPLSTRGLDKSLARPGRKQATATEDFEFHISYL
jgi:hypothetical protein